MYNVYSKINTPVKYKTKIKAQYMQLNIWSDVRIDPISWRSGNSESKHVQTNLIQNMRSHNSDESDQQQDNLVVIKPKYLYGEIAPPSYIHENCGRSKALLTKTLKLIAPS